jgi:exodeoxyribonuclease III
MRLISWNVNGIRAAYKKGFLDWFREVDADVVCLQEIKASFDKLPKDLSQVEGYRLYIESGERPGYSGVAIYSKEEVEQVKTGVKILDAEGRLIQLKYPRFTFFNVYFPNGGASDERLKYKLDFYEEFLKYINEVEGSVIFCGDVNTDLVVNVSDVVYLIAFVFGDGPPPVPEASGDVDCNGSTNVSDVVFLIEFVFGDGPNPCDPSGDGVPDC